MTSQGSQQPLTSQRIESFARPLLSPTLFQMRSTRVESYELDKPHAGGTAGPGEELGLSLVELAQDQILCIFRAITSKYSADTRGWKSEVY